MKQFDILHSPLEGTNLVEASAGTGKTYTIAGLYLRLILERGLHVNDILVVTFTEAATGELKDRIRRRLREAIHAFSSGEAEDHFIRDLVGEWRERGDAQGALREALRAFDQAAIMTIHGFCRKTLHENAFESGSLFDTELLPDDSPLRQTVIDDFWRSHLYEASLLFVRYALEKGFSPERLVSLCRKASQSSLKVIPAIEVPDTSREEETFTASFNEVREAWRRSSGEVEKVLTGDGGLNRTKYPGGKISFWVASMDRLFSSEIPDPLLFPGFEKFSAQEIGRSMKKGFPRPSHPFFSLCDRLLGSRDQLGKAFELRIKALTREAFSYAAERLEKMKRERNVVSFDDLLLRMQKALEGPGGSLLAEAVRRRYRAALVDEFQDTDPIQYSIFWRIFAEAENVLLLIGDPKQAIYGFRGADIFAYLEAASQVKTRSTLSENWRAGPGLIQAVNAIFQADPRAFIYDAIQFHPSTPAGAKEQESLVVDGAPVRPFQIWHMDALAEEGQGTVINKSEARKRISNAVAGEISRLLAPGAGARAMIGARPLHAGDIAVLLRRNEDASLMQKALSALHIPSVLYSTANLFDSHEAREIQRVLAAIAEPDRERLLRGALVTDMEGMSGEALEGLGHDQQGWERCLVRFKAYHDLWEQKGFMHMFSRYLARESVLSRLMGFPDGERRVTNVLHLMEVLHRATLDRGLHTKGLLKWLMEQRDPLSPRLEEHQLRLESDERAVKLVTIHKSKGLEYPVVFCPFMWDSSRIRRREEPFLFHDVDDRMRLTLDLGSEEREANQRLAEKEQLAENLRLLYVALTRARCCCYLVWGRFHEAETSALAYLLHSPKTGKEGDPVDRAAEGFKGLKRGAIRERLSMLQKEAGDAISLDDLPEEPGLGHVLPRVEPTGLWLPPFSGKIDRTWAVSSFSSLTSGALHTEEMRDRDRLIVQEGAGEERGLEAEKGGVPARDIFSFPRGARAGTLLHDIFEHLDFTKGDEASTGRLVLEKLAEYGFDPEWQETVCAMIRRVLSVDLGAEHEGLRLSVIPNHDRLNELGFSFLLKSLVPRDLKDLFAEHGFPAISSPFPERVGRLSFSPVRGIMRGFMDLVFQRRGRFYLVDWKSNFLGSAVEDYGPEPMARAMEEEFYFLQYHLYVVALHQYLKLRIPGYAYEKDFGSVFYIFLRGVDGDRGPHYGTYRDRPPEALIEGLSSALIDKGWTT